MRTKALLLAFVLSIALLSSISYAQEDDVPNFKFSLVNQSQQPVYAIITGHNNRSKIVNPGEDGFIVVTDVPPSLYTLLTGDNILHHIGNLSEIPQLNTFLIVARQLPDGSIISIVYYENAKSERKIAYYPGIHPETGEPAVFELSIGGKLLKPSEFVTLDEVSALNPQIILQNEAQQILAEYSMPLQEILEAISQNDDVSFSDLPEISISDIENIAQPAITVVTSLLSDIQQQVLGSTEVSLAMIPLDRSTIRRRAGPLVNNAATSVKPVVGTKSNPIIKFLGDLEAKVVKESNSTGFDPTYYTRVQINPHFSVGGDNFIRDRAIVSGETVGTTFSNAIGPIYVRPDYAVSTMLSENDVAIRFEARQSFNPQSRLRFFEQRYFGTLGVGR